jgi:hypothetical protein
VSLGPTSERLLALWQSGELTRAAEGLRTQHELAAKLGFTEASFRTAAKRLRIAGHAVPRFIWGKGLETGAIVEAGEFEDEPTNPAAPPLPAIPSGHFVKGVSTLVGADGETKGQWIKTAKQDEGREALLDAVRSLGEPLPRAESIAVPAYADEDLLCVYPMGDPHIGLLAWQADAGDNFDLGIAEHNLVAAVDHLASLAPPSKHALLITIGDTTHSDGQNNTTTKGTRVDVDGRTAKMMTTTLRVFRRSIARLLEKHAHVTLIVERGNHDELLSLMIALALAQHYESEPRVTIDVSPEMYHWFRFGLNLIGTHHGDKAKPSDLLAIMAIDRRADWGEVVHCRFYTGHLHHMMTKEVHTLIIDTLPTLASSDAWHRAMGYRSGRAMYMDVIHRLNGHINRHIVGIEQLRAR